MVKIIPGIAGSISFPSLCSLTPNAGFDDENSETYSFHCPFPYFLSNKSKALGSFLSNWLWQPMQREVQDEWQVAQLTFLCALSLEQISDCGFNSCNLPSFLPIKNAFPTESIKVFTNGCPSFLTAINCLSLCL